MARILTEKSKTHDWPKRCLNIIDRNINDPHTGILLGQTTDWKFATTYPLPAEVRLIISYHVHRKFFIIWNADIHRYIHSGTSLSINVLLPRKKITVLPNEIQTLYIERQQLSSVDYCTKGYEKVLLVGIDALGEFCRNYEEYIYPNETDNQTKTPLLFAASNTELRVLDVCSEPWNELEVLRVKEKILRARRDPSFKKRILEKYNAQCIICGSKELSILQAAHICAVQFGGDDSTDNGVCLCANHHLLYDDDLLDIQWENGTFSCCSEIEQQMPW